MNESGNTKRIETSLENTIVRLESAVNQAHSNYNQYRDKIGRLDFFTLECEAPMKTNGPTSAGEMPSTLLNQINGLISELELVNRKNNELIKQLNTLM